MPSDELPHTPYVLSYSQPSSAHRSVDLRCHGVGGGNGGGEGGGDGGGGDGGGGEGGGEGGGGEGGGGLGGGDGCGEGGGGDGGGGDGGGDGGGGDGGGGDGGGDGGGGDGGGDGGRLDTSSAQQRTACSAVVASQLATSLSSPRTARRKLLGSVPGHSSYDHTSESSCPQPPPRAAGSSYRLHNRASNWSQRSFASCQLAECRQPPIPWDELPHAPYLLSKVQPSSVQVSFDWRCHGGDGGGGDGGGDGGAVAEAKESAISASSTIDLDPSVAVA